MPHRILAGRALSLWALIFGCFLVATHVMADTAHRGSGHAGAEHRHGHGEDSSGYRAFRDREIKALSPEFVAGLRQGAGLGFALPAELNGLPGPKHLLELRDDLRLSTTQVNAITQLRDKVRRSAPALGNALIQAEQALENALQTAEPDGRKVEQLVLAAGEARARVRLSHISAHVAAAKLLRAEQIQKYAELRGYVPRD